MGSSLSESAILKEYIECPAQAMSKYDLRNLTLRKTEDALTGLLASEINSSNFDLLAYQQVLISGSKPDLFLVRKRNIRWDSDDFYPDYYFEFKFKYSFDLALFTQENLEKDTNISLVANYLENLEDLEKLYRYKKLKPNTRCIQGFFVCHNPSSIVYKRSVLVDREGIPSFIGRYANSSNRAAMNMDFLKVIERSTNEKARSWRSLLENEELRNCLIEPRGEFSIIHEEVFWLQMILFEINPLKE